MSGKWVATGWTRRVGRVKLEVRKSGTRWFDCEIYEAAYCRWSSHAATADAAMRAAERALERMKEGRDG